MWEYANILVPCGAAWIVAQMTKNLIARYKHEKNDISVRDIVVTGGMPSSHTAVMAAMTTRVGLTDGFSSTLFAVCVVVLFTTIVDATNVRMAVGEQTSYINKLMREYSEKTGEPFKEMRIVRGHTVPQVIAGLGLGIVAGLVYELIFVYFSVQW